MAVTLTCVCKKRLRVPDDSAAKQVRCPACGRVLSIPKSSRTGKPAAGFAVAAEKTKRCPLCRASVPANAVLCVQCGFNYKTGAKVAARASVDEETGGDGPGEEDAQALLRSLCPECGSAVEAGAESCSHCGADLPATAEASGSAPAEEADESEGAGSAPSGEGKRRRRKRRGRSRKDAKDAVLVLPNQKTVVLRGPRAVLNYVRRHDVDPDSMLHPSGTVGDYLDSRFSPLRLATLFFPKKAHIADCIRLGDLIGAMAFLCLLFAGAGLGGGIALGSQGESFWGKVGLGIAGAAGGLLLGAYMANTFRKWVNPENEAEDATGKSFQSYLLFHPEQAGVAYAGLIIFGVLALAGKLVGRTIGFLVGFATMWSLRAVPNSKDWFRHSSIGGRTVDQEFNKGLKTVAFTIVLPLAIWLGIILFSKGDMGKLEGTWAVVSAETHGRANDNFKRAELIVDDKEATLMNYTPHGTGYALWKGKWTIDPKKQPKTIDFALAEGPVLRAIYQLDGNGLQLCLPMPGDQGVVGERPTAFDSKQGLLFRFRRATE